MTCHHAIGNLFIFPRTNSLSQRSAVNGALSSGVCFRYGTVNESPARESIFPTIFLTFSKPWTWHFTTTDSQINNDSDREAGGAKSPLRFLFIVLLTSWLNAKHVHFNCLPWLIKLLFYKRTNERNEDLYSPWIFWVLRRHPKVMTQLKVYCEEINLNYHQSNFLKQPPETTHVTQAPDIPPHPIYEKALFISPWTFVSLWVKTRRLMIWKWFFLA